MTTHLLQALIYLLVIIAAGYGAFWFTDMGIPEPMRWIAKLLIAILGIVAIVLYVLPPLGLS